MIRFTVPGDAVSFGTQNTQFKRGNQLVRGQTKTTKAKDWEAEVRRCAAIAMGEAPMIEGPVGVFVHTRFALPQSRYLKSSVRPADWKVTKPDEDKILRLVLDGMEKVVYPHDAQVCAQGFWKTTGAQGEPAQTLIIVSAIESTIEDLDPDAVFGGLRTGGFFGRPAIAEEHEYMLVRAYAALCREGWEPGESSAEFHEELNHYLDAMGWDHARRNAWLDSQTRGAA